LDSVHILQLVLERAVFVTGKPGVRVESRGH
jgi:hypothetical protein